VAGVVSLPSSAVAALLRFNAAALPGSSVAVAAVVPRRSTAEAEEGRAAVEAAGAPQAVAGTVVDKLQFVIVCPDRSC